MAKRRNEDDSERAAKKTANSNESKNIAEKQKIQAARTALDRLDYKNAIKICTELIDSDPSDLVTPLLLRSMALDATRNHDHSMEDAERALNIHQCRKTHLRRSFAHLAQAFHHVKLAQAYPVEDDPEDVYSLTEGTLEELENEIQSSGAREVGNPFRRVPASLFLHIVSFLSAPSIVKFSATCKSSQSSIRGSKELFRNFKMQDEIGTAAEITAGIKTFGQRCGNSIKCIRVEIQGELNDKDQQDLKEVLLPHSKTLTELSIGHSGCLDELIIEVAANCPSLKVLSSTPAGEGEDSLPSVKDKDLQLPSTWKLKLDRFVWNSRGKSLIFDPNLIESLRNATEIRLNSYGLTPSIVVELLSSASNLSELLVVRMEDEVVEEIPSLNLPKMKALRLPQPIRSSTTQDASLFFKSLHTPDLEKLVFEKVSIKDLSSWNPGSNLRLFCSFEFSDVGGKDKGEEDARRLLELMKEWNNLKALELQLPSSTPISFWNHLLRLLTLYSRENIEGGFRQPFLFPKLQSIVFGLETIASGDGVDDGEMLAKSQTSGSALVNFVASRLASHCMLSKAQIALIANGGLEVTSAPQPVEDLQNQALESCCRIQAISVYYPLTFMDESHREWLQNNVADVDLGKS